MAGELNLSNIQPAQKRVDRKRVGRGMGSGKGRYSGRGIKGQKSRAGSHMMRAGFEGGQMPLSMRTAKLRGNTSKDAMPIGPFRTYTQPVNVRDLDRFEEGDEVNSETLKAKGLIRSVRKDVKLLGVGELTKKLSITVHGPRPRRARRSRRRVARSRCCASRRCASRRTRSAAPRAVRRRAAPAPPTTTRPTLPRSWLPPKKTRRKARPSPRALLGLERLARPGPAKRLLFTAAMLAAYRLGSWMPAPGVDSKTIENYFNGQGGVFGLLNLFSGSALSRFSIFALGIMPYVTASIILQLMTVVIPSLEQLQKEGEAGTAKINQYTRYLTIILALAQGTGYTYLFHRQGALPGNTGRLLLVVVTLTAGTALLMWLGELITKRGIGNGISLLIFASILSSAPAGIQSWINGSPLERLFFPIIAIGDRGLGRLRAGRAAPDPDPVREADGGPAPDRRRCDLHAAAREHGGRDPGHLRRGAARDPADRRARSRRPPSTSSSSTSRSSRGATWRTEFALILIFTFFYTAVQFNPVDQADNLRKYGGFIPGIRPGPPTALYLDTVLKRLTLPGSLFLGTIAVLPSIFINQFHFQQNTSRALGGTSVLIVVGVALDTMRQMESQMMMRSYEGFLR